MAAVAVPGGLAVMLHTTLTPWIFVPLYERLSGQRPWTELRRLQALQWRSPEELEARALGRLHRLLAHAHAHVPHYRDLFARAGMRPADIRTLADLSRLPLTAEGRATGQVPARRGCRQPAGAPRRARSYVRGRAGCRSSSTLTAPAGRSATPARCSSRPGRGRARSGVGRDYPPSAARGPLARFAAPARRRAPRAPGSPSRRSPPTPERTPRPGCCRAVASSCSTRPSPPSSRRRASPATWSGRCSRPAARLVSTSARTGSR